MGYASDLVASGYGGYQGWGDTEALADFRATGGSGKQTGGGGGGGGGGGFQPISPTDLAGLRQQADKLLQPYYEQVAKEANGDYNRAVQILQEDYTKGVRTAKQNYAFTNKYGIDELKNTLDSLGVSFNQEQEGAIDKLNQRGAAVYQNNPDGTPNVVQQSTIQANGDPASGNFNTSSTITNPANTANLGRGGVEMNQLLEGQRLRQEAEQRAKTQPLEQAGITLKQYTNTPAGVNPNQSPQDLAKALAAPGVDRSQLGSSELSLVRGQEQSTRDYQKTTEDLANQRSQNINSLAGSVASLGQKEIPQQLAQQYQKELQSSFVNTGNT